MRLGTPVTVVTTDLNGYGSTSSNTLGVPILIGTAYALPYTSWNGYAMITEGAAWHESWGNNMVVSGNADVRIGGQRLRVIIGSPWAMSSSWRMATWSPTLVSNTGSKPTSWGLRAMQKPG